MTKRKDKEEKPFTLEWVKDGRIIDFHPWEEMYLRCKNCIYYPICRSRRCVK